NLDVIAVLSKQPQSAAADHFILHSHHGDWWLSKLFNMPRPKLQKKKGLKLQS
ncbi:hypothetical protein A2U01_0068102, partial [Trifolium medium]|nr:hypothetical protein [Trifolium medium]